jgi:hypothetical protein
MTTNLTFQQQGQILLYQTDDNTVRFEVIFENETVWLSQDQMARLFDRDQSVISKHIKNIYAEWELNEKSTMQKMHIAISDKPVVFYNLDVIISVGYRVKSLRWTKFRMRATSKLKEYIIKGFVLDDERLSEWRTANQYYEELIERIRKIRTSERNFYQKITDIFSTSIDYDKNSDLTKNFFATVQNKMHYGIHGHTAAEVIAGRVDHTKPFMGLTTRKWKEIHKTDITIAKNYLTEDELSKLNLLAEQYLSFAELQAKFQKQMTMKDWILKLNDFLRLNEREILEHLWTISKEFADQKALAEYKKYQARLPYKSDFDLFEQEAVKPILETLN